MSHLKRKNTTSAQRSVLGHPACYSGMVKTFNIAIVLDIINVDTKLCTRAILVHTTFSDCDHISRSLQHHLVMEIHGCIFILSSSDFLLLYAWTRSLLPTFAIIDALFFNKNCNIVLEVVVFFVCCFLFVLTLFQGGLSVIA